MPAQATRSHRPLLAQSQLYEQLDEQFVPLDQQRAKTTSILDLIPQREHRSVGKKSYAEWAHIAGIFQTLMFLHLKQKEGNQILDLGCGTGQLAVSASPFVGKGGKYTGVEVRESLIEFGNDFFPRDQFDFVHFNISNPAYSVGRDDVKTPWPLESDSFDLVTALSLWTHLAEEDALFYVKELARVLKSGSRAIITVFLLDEIYQQSLPERTDAESPFHRTRPSRWIYDQSAYGSDAWFHPSWTKVPEEAIGFTQAGLKRLLDESGLTLVDSHQGCWKEVPGIYFQDVLVLEKP